MNKKYMGEILAKEVNELDQDDWTELSNYLIQFNSLQGILNELRKGYNVFDLSIENNIFVIGCGQKLENDVIWHSSFYVSFELDKSVANQSPETRVNLAKLLFNGIERKK